MSLSLLHPQAPSRHRCAVLPCAGLAPQTFTPSSPATLPFRTVYEKTEQGQSDSRPKGMLVQNPILTRQHSAHASSPSEWPEQNIRRTADKDGNQIRRGQGLRPKYRQGRATQELQVHKAPFSTENRLPKSALAVRPFLKFPRLAPFL